jgi:hypothetical protein
MIFKNKNCQHDYVAIAKSYAPPFKCYTPGTEIK